MLGSSPAESMLGLGLSLDNVVVAKHPQSELDRGCFSYFNAVLCADALLSVDVPDVYFVVNHYQHNLLDVSVFQSTVEPEALSCSMSDLVLLSASTLLRSLLP